MTEPLISVIMPARNAAETVGVAIASILRQTYPNLEIIVIDDNSTDDTGRVVARSAESNKSVRYYKLPYDDRHRSDRRGVNINAGWMARNYGMEKARGEWITFQDADDASLSNRIEAQHRFAMEYGALHVCIDWQRFEAEYVGKSLDIEKFTGEKADILVSTGHILCLIKETRGPLMRVPGGPHRVIPFWLKRFRFIEKLFFKSWEPYPGTGGAPMVKKEVVMKIAFRPLHKRAWPSARGRGADRDFNFAVAEAFGKSICLKLPLYLWRVNSQNPEYADCELGKYVRR